MLEKIKVGGITYSIELVSAETEELQGNYGYIDYNKCKMFINKSLHPDLKEEVLCELILLAIGSHMEVDDKVEDVISKNCAKILRMVMVDNWNFKKFKLRHKAWVRLGGSRYYIYLVDRYNKELKYGEAAGRIEFSSRRIWLPKELDQHKALENLFHEIWHWILDFAGIKDDIDIEDTVLKYSKGFFQVFIDNDIKFHMY
ncbi:hypothetical protein BBF96_03490 [Anoxybacter fermentans]|uniref:Uncharacterized protein n=1 Tax=Anoxybacter fermentans TaxID=1323375 RepID=A0A3Q9HPF2_9FIRM|nr:hypothetical protein [Anoxybacter fermentans]AZR72526.1 hypothetical protein BBF96_03490 [Anoxybacter fermentans]